MHFYSTCNYVNEFYYKFEKETINEFYYKFEKETINEFYYISLERKQL